MLQITVVFNMTFSRTRCIISLFDLLAAKCNPLSPPSFTAVTLAPRNKSKSNTAVCPSLEAQRSGVKPWSSLEKRTIELSMKGHENARDLSQTRPHHDVQVNSINIKSCCFKKLYGTACKVSGVWMHQNIRSVTVRLSELRKVPKIKWFTCKPLAVNRSLLDYNWQLFQFPQPLTY